MANPEHVEVVRQGAEAIAEWRRLNPTRKLELSGADLKRADLSGGDLTLANLRQATLFQADLSGADLSGADLRTSHLIGANLSGARLVETDLRGANLLGADLSGADLTAADLTFANLARAKLSSVNLTAARLGATSICAVDMSQVRGLSSVSHRAASSVGADTLITSVRGARGRRWAGLRTFFRSAGVPSELLDVAPAIVAEVKYHTCFVAYGQPDAEFACRLYEDLKARGVSCWLYEMHATPGERTWTEIVRKRREADKVVVLCSADALVRPGVLKEIEEQVDEDPDKIVPISLDDLWKASGFRVMRAERDLKPYLLERNYADFANLPYKEALERLLTGLRRETEQKEG